MPMYKQRIATLFFAFNALIGMAACQKAAESKHQVTAAPGNTIDANGGQSTTSPTNTPGGSKTSSCSQANARTWTPAHATLPGIQAPERAQTVGSVLSLGLLAGAPFSAVPLRLEGVTSPHSLETIVLQLPGCSEKGWPLASFSDADRAYIESQRATLRPAYPKDPVTYQLLPNELGDKQDPNTNNFLSSQHFGVYWPKTLAGGANWGTDQARQASLRYMEDVWGFFAYRLQAWPPYKALPANIPGRAAADQSPHLLNVVLLADGDSCNAAASVSLPLLCLVNGTGYIPHEFGHTIQMYSGGFREDGAGGFAHMGWFWETHANFGARLYLPVSDDSGMSIHAFYSHKAGAFSDTDKRYDNWPVLRHIYESKRFPKTFLFDLWRTTSRDQNGNTTEDPLESIMRQAATAGIFTGKPVQAFGDVIGDMAARMATMDYTYERTYLDELAVAGDTLGDSHAQALGQGLYTPVAAEVPAQYGFNVYAVTPTPGSTQVSVNLRPYGQPGAQAAWRVTLIAVGADGVRRYSPSGSRDGANLPLLTGDTALYVAVAATPDQYVVQSPDKYPYALQLTGGTIKTAAP